MLRAKKVAEEVEFGFDSFSEEEKEILKKVIAKIEEVSGTSLLDTAKTLRECFERRDIYKNASWEIKSILELGGVFVPVELLYLFLFYMCVFSQNEETTQVLEDCAGHSNEILKEAIEKRQVEHKRK